GCEGAGGRVQENRSCGELRPGRKARAVAGMASGTASVVRGALAAPGVFGRDAGLSGTRWVAVNRSALVRAAAGRQPRGAWLEPRGGAFASAASGCGTPGKGVFPWGASRRAAGVDVSSSLV